MLKNIFHSLERHCGKFDTYFDVYEHHFNKFIGKSPIVVEVGICRGGSAEMWKNYFKENATIIGVDFDLNAFRKEYQTPGCKQVYGDQGDPQFWKKFFTDYPKVDIFIDDGGHHQYQQITTLEAIWPHLNLGGVYLCEDTHTSYWPEYGGGLNHSSSFIEYSKNLIDLINIDHINFSNKHENIANLLDKYKDINAIHYYDSIVVIDKKSKIKASLLTSTPI